MLPMRTYNQDSQIVYFDSDGIPHSALVVSWWGGQNRTLISSTGEPGCNLVYISTEVDGQNAYCKQVKRVESVTHKSKQLKTANYWCWPDEVGV